MSNETSGTGGTGGRGGLIQLVAYGAEDLVLTANPEITFFTNTYMRHVNFSMESINLLFTDIPGFGKTSFITIKRSGDLLHRLYLELTLPTQAGSFWTNRVGFNIINRVELYIGNKIIDRMYGIWMHIWTELTHSNSKKQLLIPMIGSTGPNGTTNGLSCAIAHKLIIPLFFYFCRNPGLAIPLNAIRNNQNISLKFFFETKTNCIQNGTLPTDDFSNASIWADYIFLETEENRLYVQKPLEYLIEVSQHRETNLVVSGTKSILMGFSLPCKELYWIIYKKDGTGDKFTDFTDDDLPNSSMMVDMQLIFNTKDVFSSGARDSNYFNYVQAYQHHTGFPDLGINCYSFAISPEDHQPSGFINFKQISIATMAITPKTSNGLVHIFGLCYNILKIKYGDISLEYKY
jgi:hypothetical protein